MNVLDNSVIIRFIYFLSYYIKKILKNSTIVNFFTTIGNESINKYLEKSLLYQIIEKTMNLLKKIIFKTKLDKYLRNSIFINSQFWLFLIILTIPIAPTVLLAILCIVAFMSLVLKKCVDDGFEFKRITINYLIIAFIICIIFSSLFSYKNLSLLGIMGLNIIIMLGYFIAINSINNLTDLKKLLKCFIAIGLFVSVYGIYQYVFGNSITELSWVDTEMFENISGRVTSTFNNPNVLGEYLIFLVMICLAFFITEKNKKQKIFYGICFLLSLGCILLTYSRGCWIGLLVALALMLLIKDKRLILGYIILILLALVIMPDSIVDRFASIGDTADSSTSYRVNIWSGTFDMLKSFWISGIGYGIPNFKHVYTYYSYMLIDTQHPHNLFLTILCGLGIIGLLVFVIIMILYFKRLISSYVKNRKCNNEDIKFLNTLLLSFSTSMIGMLIQGMFDNIWYNYSIFLLFFIMIGMGSAITFIIEKEEQHEKNK